MIPNTRDEFKAYVLRALGDGVLQINVTDDQIEDRMDEAVFMFQQFHMDAVETTYIQHQITPSDLYLNANSINGTFVAGEILGGITTGVVARMNEVVTNSHFKFTELRNSGVPGPNTFAVGESVVGLTSNANGTVSANGVVYGDYDNGYITLPTEVIGVKRIFAPFDSRISADILFDPQSQFNMSLLANFTSSSVVPYFIGRTYQQLLNDMFRGRPGIRFTRHTGKVYLDINMLTNCPTYSYIIIDAVKTIDPDDYPLIWSDRWLQRYAIALTKRQWGTNLSKYNGIALPGGVTLDGMTMYSNAQTEVMALETELRDTYMEPPAFIVG